MLPAGLCDWVLGLQSMGGIGRVWFTTDKLSFPKNINPGHDRRFLQFLFAKCLPNTCYYSQGPQQEGNPSPRMSQRRAHRAGLLSENYRDPPWNGLFPGCYWLAFLACQGWQERDGAYTGGLFRLLLKYRLHTQPPFLGLRESDER